VDALLERIAPWRNALLMVSLVALLLLAFQVPAARPHVAHGLMVGFGPLLALLAWTRIRDGSAALSVSWVILGAAISCVAGYAAWRGIEPSAPLDAADLRAVSEVAPLDVPDHGEPFRLRVSGELEGRTRDSVRAPYEVYLSRGEAELRVRGELHREVREEAGRGGPPQRSVSLHLTEVHDVALSGRGPASVTPLAMEHLDGPLRVAVLSPFGWDAWWLALLGGLLGMAVILEISSDRAHTWTPLTAVAGLTLVLGQYVAVRYDVDQPLVTLLGGGVFAGIVGGVGGTVVGLAATWVGRAVSQRRDT
jgi:hypothetical protein